MQLVFFTFTVKEIDQISIETGEVTKEGEIKTIQIALHELPHFFNEEAKRYSVINYIDRKVLNLVTEEEFIDLKLELEETQDERDELKKHLDNAYDYISDVRDCIVNAKDYLDTVNSYLDDADSNLDYVEDECNQ